LGFAGGSRMILAIIAALAAAIIAAILLED
jgi:hypothetical protein